MGGGDLNLKKSWHPSTLRNIERVWKAEQKHEAEQRKIEQLQRELAEERAKEEMQNYAEHQGVVKKKEEKLDWMYQGPAALVDREQYLTGRQIDKTFEILEQYEQGNASHPPENECHIGSLFNQSSSAAPVDIANKIREDPLFMIRKQEEEKQKKLFNNPIKLKQLQEMLKNSLASSKDKKKKRKKHKTKQRNSDDDKTTKRKHHHINGKYIVKTKLCEKKSSMSKNDSKRHHRKKYSSDSDSSNSSESSRNNFAKQRYRKKHSNDSDSCDSSESSGTNNFSKQHHRKKRSNDSDSNDSNHNKRKYNEMKYDRKDIRFDIQNGSYKQQHHEPSKKKISKEELERKRQEMLDNAVWREQQRHKNILQYKEEDIKESASSEILKSKDFIKPMLSKAAATGTVEARIKQNIYNIQRNKGSMDTNFARR